MSERAPRRAVDADWVRATAASRGFAAVDAERAATESAAVLSAVSALARSLRADEDIYRFRRLLEEAAQV